MASQPKYNANSFVKCECGANVHVANGGNGNLEQHRASKEHRQAVADKKIQKISNFFKPAPAVRRAPEPPRLLSRPSNNGPPSGAVVERAADATAQPARSELSRSELSPALHALYDASRELPDSVLVASPGDVLSHFATTPVFAADASPDDNWEAANSILHGQLSYLKSGADLIPLIRRGPLGLDALCTWMNYCIVSGRVAPVNFQPKIDLFVEAIRLIATQRTSVKPLEAASTIVHASAQHMNGTQATQPNVAPVPEVFVDLTVDDDIDGTSTAHDVHDRAALPAAIESDRPRVPHTAREICYGYPVQVPPGVNPGRFYPWMTEGDSDADRVSRPWTANVLHRRLYLQSAECAQEYHDPPCGPCKAVGELPAVRALINRATNGAAEHTSWKYLNMEQQSAKLANMEAQIRKKNLYGLNTAKKLLNRTRALNDHKRLVRSVARSDVPNICVAIRVGLRNHRGVGGLLEKVAAAKERLYKPKDFLRRDYDVARLLHCVGGDSAVAIASRALNLPSLRTIKRHSRTAPLEVSTGYPKAVELSRNIDSMYPTGIVSAAPGPEQATGRAADTTKCAGVVGVALMVDEISLERRLRYDSRHNTILGLCREHSTSLSKDFNSMDDANAIWTALREKETHLACEATVAALGPLSGHGSSYVARAIHVSGSCKKEDAVAHSRLLSTIYSAASTHPKLEGARIYYLATDGDAKRGAAAVPLTLSQELDADSSIFEQLCDLPLFNTLCGRNDVTLDKDYKHLFKRFRTCLCSERGIDILGEILTPDLLRQHLHDCGMSSTRSHALFNPNDAQDVPLACDLMTEIMRLPAAPPTASPGYARKRCAIRLLGQLYGFILKPYLTPSYTVREQLNDIFTAMHMMMVFYVDARGAFCPIQTYADFMHAGKNVAFCVAKIKVDMPDGPFYLVLMGSDRLEFSFARVRTLVPNDSNADIFQCGGRLSTASEMSEILIEHPDWDRGTSRRLHLAPLDSEGRISRNVDHISPKSWTGDVSVRNVSIRTAWRTGRQRAIEVFKSYGYDAAAIFKRLEDDGRDILHPLGRPVFKPELRGADEVLENNNELTEDSTSQPAPPSRDLEPDIEDLAGAELAEDVGRYSPKVDLPGGKSTYKASVLREIMDPDSSPGPDSTDRLSRVRGHERFPRRPPAASAAERCIDVDADDVCVVNDPAITVLRCAGTMFEAVVQIASLQLNGVHVQCVSTDELVQETTRVGFQVLKLHPVPLDTESPVLAAERNEGHLPIQNDWFSDAETVKFKTTNAIITTSGALVRPYSPAIDATHGGRYFFTTNELLSTGAELLEQVCASEQLSIPEVPEVTAFPYSLDGKRCFACADDDGSELPNLVDPLSCTICPSEKGLTKSVPKLLEHNSAHILHDRKLRGKKHACGFCLRDGTCRFWLTVVHGKTQLDLANSICAKRPARISYAPALQCSLNSPCTNIPIRCPKCSERDEAIFKYNLEAHFREKHADDVDQYENLWKLSHEEQKGMAQVWKRIKNARQKKNTKTQIKSALILSEAHNVHRACIPSATEPEEAGPAEAQAHEAEIDKPDDIATVQEPVVPSAAEDELDITYELVDYEPPAGTRSSTRLRKDGKRKQISIARICLCDAEERTGNEHDRADLVLCVAEGCEAEYYHRDCLSRDDLSRVPFICDSCRPVGSRKHKLRRA